MIKKYWIGLSLIPGIGSLRLRQLLDFFNGPEGIWQASKKELQAVRGIGPRLAENIIRTRNNLNLDLFLRDCARAKIQVVTLADEKYPSKLREIYDAPPVLYYRGTLIDADQHSMAIVGSRKMTAYGARVTRKLVGELVEQGLTIISGMALGIDATAHATALKKGGRTLAILGSGVDKIYPPEHHELYQKIIRSGAVISSFPPGTSPERKNFPARNRIISGLAYGTVVIEAGKRSGALITADQALEQNREVFAVPGSIFNPMSVGTNALIQKGAKPVCGGKDVLEELAEFSPGKKKTGTHSLPVDLSDLEELLVSYLESQELNFDELLRLTGLEQSTLNSALFELELRGVITQMPGHKFALL